MAGWHQVTNIRGPIGPIGPAGVAGVAGPIGPTGGAGPAGPAGATGAGLNPRGPWMAFSAYAVNDLVTYNGSTWRTKVAHTSTTTGATGAPAATGDSAANWEQFAASGGAGAGSTFYGLTLDKTTAILSLVTIAPDSGTVIDLGSYAAFFFASDTPTPTLTWNAQRLANLLLTAKIA